MIIQEHTNQKQYTLEPQTTIYKWLLQLDDFKSLHSKWLDITKHPF